MYIRGVETVGLKIASAGLPSTLRQYFNCVVRSFMGKNQVTLASWIIDIRAVFGMRDVSA